MGQILFPVSESRSHWRPHSPAKTTGSRPDGRDLAIPRTKRPDPDRLVKIWPFPNKTSQIPAYLAEELVAEVSGWEIPTGCCVFGMLYSSGNGRGIFVFMC